MDQFLRLRIDLDHAITFGRDKEALTIARAGLAFAKEKNISGEVEYFTAQFFILEENFSMAIIHLDKAIAFNPGDGAAFNDKALCSVELGRFDAALADFDQGIKVEPDYSTIHHNKGWFLNKLGRYNEAIECFDNALKLEPGRAVTYENLGDTYLNLGLNEKARQAYQSALRYLPFDCGEIKIQIEKLLMQIV